MAVPRFPAAVPKLQRSRRPKTAESNHRSWHRAWLKACFNGAAVRRRRRVRACDSVLLVCGASTEPPSEDGGEEPSMPCSAT